MSSMVERVAEAMQNADYAMQRAAVRGEDTGDEYVVLARAAIEAMKDPPLDILGAMFEAMFEDKWDCTQAPMVGLAGPHTNCQHWN